MPSQLYYLSCAHNILTELEVSRNAELMNLSCADNMISVLDTRNCLGLKELNCANNPISALNVSCNGELHNLRCAGLSELLIGDNQLLKTRSVRADGNGAIGYLCYTETTNLFAEEEIEPKCLQLVIWAESKDENTAFCGWYNSAGELISSENMLSLELTDRILEGKDDGKNLIATIKHVSSMKDEIVARFSSICGEN